MRIKNILQNNIGFNGVIFSDDLTMKGAGKINMQEKAMKAINAGCDMVLVCNDYEGTNQVINCFENCSISFATLTFLSIGIISENPSGKFVSIF